MHKAGLVLLVLFAGCNNDRITRLEKQTADLEHQVAQLHQSGQLELQAKCSKDARAWFNENWRRERDTILLDYTNHYSLSKNRCFIRIEYRFSGISSIPTWFSSVLVYDVYENQKYGEITESNDADKTTVTRCEIYGRKCTTNQEFSSFIAQFMTN